MKNPAISLTEVQKLTPHELELYRERGDEYRYRLSGTVIAALELSAAWVTDFEQRREWGGQFPVHIRLTHLTYPGLLLELYSPAYETSEWIVKCWIGGSSARGRTCWASRSLEARALLAVVAKIEEYAACFPEPARLTMALQMSEVAQ